ncbi:MAG: DUF4625 domain-containing protein [Flavobacteriales bacterium]|nr:DUF4625 domain-containing protein [Flavobacteriales bacterium]
MKTKSIFAIAILALAATFTSCKKDKENPTITVETPAEHADTKWGETVHVNATFSDDRDLASYHVTVVDAATNGEHIHSFGFMEHGDISGTSYDFHSHFDVPTDAPEMAWISFEVTDAEGKVTELTWMQHFSE